jgi:hypothetical protein
VHDHARRQSQQPDQRLQTPQQPPPQNPQPFGGSIGGPIQETGNYGNLGLGGQKQPGVGGSSLVNPPQPQDPRIDERVYSVLTVDASVASRTSYGGTAPVRVREQVERAKKRLER